MTPPAERHDEGPAFGPGHVLEVKTGGYMVQSKSTTGVWYLVHERSCSCKAGQAGTRCVHRRQVAAFVAALNEDTRRHSAPAAVSMLVD